LLPMPHVGDVRGKGLMVGFEIVQDKATKEPFPPARQTSRRIQDEAFRRGVVIYCCTGCRHGTDGDMILMAPPLIITREQIDEVVSVVKEAIHACC